MRKALQKTLLAGLASVGAILFLECGIRWMAPHALAPPLEEQIKNAQHDLDQKEQTLRLKDFDPVFHHTVFPKRNTTGQLENHPYRYTTNELGFRGSVEFQRAKAPGTHRIAILGDSFTEGLFVSDDETYPAQLQTLLSNETKGQAWEIYNFGQTSYSPLLYWQLYEHRVRSFQPDTIVIAIDNSDLQDDYYYEKDTVFGPQNEVIGFKDTHYAFFLGQSRNQESPRHQLDRLNLEKSTIWGRTKGFLLAHSQLSALLADKWNPEQIRFGDIDTDRFGHLRPGYDWTQHWKRTEGYLTRLIGAAQRDHVKVILLYYPYGLQINGTEWPGRSGLGFHMGQIYDTPLRKWLAELARKRQVPLLDTVSTFQNAAASSHQKISFENDPHLLPFGHKILAATLFRHLTSGKNQIRNPPQTPRPN